MEWWRHADASRARSCMPCMAWWHAGASRTCWHADAPRGWRLATYAPGRWRHAADAPRVWWYAFCARFLVSAQPLYGFRPGSPPDGSPAPRGQPGRGDSRLCRALLSTARRAGQHDPLRALVQPRHAAGDAAVAPRAAADLDLAHEAARSQRVAHLRRRRRATPARHLRGGPAPAPPAPATSRDRGEAALEHPRRHLRRGAARRPLLRPGQAGGSVPRGAGPGRGQRLLPRADQALPRPAGPRPPDRVGERGLVGEHAAQEPRRRRQGQAAPPAAAAEQVHQPLRGLLVRAPRGDHVRERGDAHAAALAEAAPRLLRLPAAHHLPRPRAAPHGLGPDHPPARPLHHRARGAAARRRVDLQPQGGAELLALGRGGRHPARRQLQHLLRRAHPLRQLHAARQGLPPALGAGALPRHAVRVLDGLPVRPQLLARPRALRRALPRLRECLDQPLRRVVARQRPGAVGLGGARHGAREPLRRHQRAQPQLHVAERPPGGQRLVGIDALAHPARLPGARLHRVVHQRAGAQATQPLRPHLVHQQLRPAGHGHRADAAALRRAHRAPRHLLQPVAPPRLRQPRPPPHQGRRLGPPSARPRAQVAPALRAVAVRLRRARRDAGGCAKRRRGAQPPDCDLLGPLARRLPRPRAA
mmetsp:Transcript_20876/g.49452  ORF Transcript_20876/g.49452 Transcript_20876/m.49452 type:complete len:645 (-) Transcript_20876:812-2746(-)